MLAKVQRVFQVGTIKKILQQKLSVPITAKVLKQHYDKHLEIKSGEAATEHFLTTALALWNALFSVPKLRATWLHCSVVFSLMSSCIVVYNEFLVGPFIN